MIVNHETEMDLFFLLLIPCLSGHESRDRHELILFGTVSLLSEVMRVIARILVLLAACWYPSAVLAHGALERATPTAGSTVHGSPAEVKLSFSQALEPAFSTLRVLDASGKRVDRQDQTVDAADARELRVSLPPLTPGAYRVIWRVLSRDGHVTQGDLIFTVAP
jgi:methionine-rich copper-binding protein CopC